MQLRDWTVALGRLLLPLDHPAQAVYGTVITGAVMSAYSEPPVELDEVLIHVPATVAVYWLAHVYAEQLVHAEQGVPFSRRRLPAAMRNQWPIIQSALTPLLVLLLALLCGATTTIALAIAVWFTVFLLSAFGLVGARRGGLKGRPVVKSALLAGILGLIVVGLKSSVD
ncbi:hypothetical protein [Streptomyces sp. NPDC051776]|uniref:hypothetical protein n=1 Tax=Streptomyces sp. NPDC051776 TaxID=3155414 RepID=UPI003432035E